MAGEKIESVGLYKHDRVEAPLDEAIADIRGTTAEATILILPGLGDSGPEHWQSLWLNQYPNAVKVEQREWNHPEMDEWVSTLDGLVIRYGKVVLVGHSLACPTIAHWADKYSTTAGAAVKGALLVAPPDTDTQKFAELDTYGFSPTPLNLLPFRSTVVASTNDEWADIERAEYFAQCWGAQFVNIGPYGHINAAAGFGPWPTGEALLRSLL